MSQQAPQSAVNQVSPVIVLIFLVILLVEALFSLGSAGLIGGPQSIGWRNTAIAEFGFSARFLQHALEIRSVETELLARFVTYPFVHINLTHAALGGALLLALGKFVGDVFAGWAVLAVFLFASFIGALVFGLAVDTRVALIGSYPGVYGLVGAYTFINLLWMKALGERQILAFRLIGMLLAIQLLFGILFGSHADWVADIAGFVGGFLLSFLVSPGGWSRLRARIRHD